MRVLIITNDQRLAEKYRQTLTRSGLQSRLVGYPERAPDLVAQQAVDAIVLDVDLRTTNAPRVVWSLRQDGQRLPIMALRDADGAWDAHDLEDLGFDLVLDKPVAPDHLLQAVRTLRSLPDPLGASDVA